MEIEFGNAEQLDTNGTGWFIGFSDWAKANLAGGANLRFMADKSLAHSIQVKWMEHSKNDDRGIAKPPSVGRTISILVSESGNLRLEFCPDKNFSDGQVVTYTLRQHGDFVIWGENIYHRWFVDEKCVILTFRWVPLQPSQS